MLCKEWDWDEARAAWEEEAEERVRAEWELSIAEKNASLAEKNEIIAQLRAQLDRLDRRNKHMF